MKPYSFNTSFSQLLQKIKKETKKKKKTIATGDFSLSLLNYAKNIGTYEFLQSVFSNNFTPQINLPTRVTRNSSTLIGNILINSQENVYTSRNLTTFILDHLPHFTIIENLLIDTLVNKDVKIDVLNLTCLIHVNFVSRCVFVFEYYLKLKLNNRY